jgi:hypothetical protein
MSRGTADGPGAIPETAAVVWAARGTRTAILRRWQQFCRVKTAFLSRDVLFLKVGALNFLGVSMWGNSVGTCSAKRSPLSTLDDSPVFMNITSWLNTAQHLYLSWTRHGSSYTSLSLDFASGSWSHPYAQDQEQISGNGLSYFWAKLPTQTLTLQPNGSIWIPSAPKTSFVQTDS